MTEPSFGGLHARATELAARWTEQRAERQRRRHLDRADFDALRDAGFLLAAVPRQEGGFWDGAERSLRPLCEVLRSLAGGDPSVALVASMHPAVLSFWLMSPAPEQPEWERQRKAVFASAVRGAQWGTITSEPGSGGDIMRTRTRAVSAPDEASALPGRPYRLHGDKHFGSGLGISNFMFTTAVPDDGKEPAAFFIDVHDYAARLRGRLDVTAEWDGVGMSATQSHAARLEGAPAVRLAHGGAIADLNTPAAPVIGALFTAVVLGVLDEAIRVARAQLASRRDSLRAFEQVEWTRAVLDAWVAVQAYEGALRAVESGDNKEALRATLRAKTTVAELAEASLSRISRVLGGGTFSRRSPFSSWFEDVRALGFLRPPWGLAADNLFALSWE